MEGHGPMPDPQWWACSEPERPFDMGTVYEQTCRACRIKATVDMAQHGDRVLLRQEDGSDEDGYWLSELVAGRPPS